MRNTRFRSARPKLGAALAVGIPLLACAPTTTPLEIEAGEPLLAPEEKSLWARANAHDRKIAAADLLLGDESVRAYLDAVAASLMTEMTEIASPGGCTVRVLKEPTVSAYALPNGSIYITTGLLARVSNEAQLATVLGHELGHYVRRHAYRDGQNVERKRRVAIAATVVGALLTGPMAGLVDGVVRPWLYLGPISTYSRELEFEADRIGLTAARNAGYDASSGVALLRHLKAEEPDSSESSRYSSHPELDRRIDSFETLISEWGSGRGALKEEVFLTTVRPAALLNIEYDLRATRPESALITLRHHLAHSPDDARLHYLAGEHARFFHGPSWKETAQREYLLATELDPVHARAHFELGMLEQARSNPERARVEFARYLELEPDASDRVLIESYLEDAAKAR